MLLRCRNGLARRALRGPQNCTSNAATRVTAAIGRASTRVLWTRSSTPPPGLKSQTSAHNSSITCCSSLLEHKLAKMESANLAPALARSHSSHSNHSHHSHHNHAADNVYLTSTNKNDAGVRITRIGLYVNLGMAISKGVGGYVFHSQGMSRAP